MAPTNEESNKNSLDGLNFDFFAFTYKHNACAGEYVSKDSYDVVLSHIKKHAFIKCVYYEKDSKERYHIHGTVLAPKDLSYRKMKIDMYTSKWFRIYDYAGWDSYIQKDQDQDVVTDDGTDDGTDEFGIIKKSLFAKHIIR